MKDQEEEMMKDVRMCYFNITCQVGGARVLELSSSLPPGPVPRVSGGGYTCTEQHLICCNCIPKVKVCPVCKLKYEKSTRHRLDDDGRGAEGPGAIFLSPPIQICCRSH